jgi:vanillate O-demethylase monooxygenase subunit
VWHAVTPGTRHTTNYFFAMGSNDRDGVEFMVDYLKPVIAEDVFATEAIEKIISTMDEVPTELMLRSDTTAVMGRRVLQAMMDAEAAAQQS